MREAPLELGEVFMELVRVARKRHGLHVSMILADLLGEALAALLEKLVSDKADPVRVLGLAARVAAELADGDPLELELSPKRAVIRLRLSQQPKGVPELVEALEELFSAAARIAIGPGSACLVTIRGEVLEAEVFADS